MLYLGLSLLTTGETTPPAPAIYTYLRPGGTETYFRLDGTSQYRRR